MKEERISIGTLPWSPQQPQDTPAAWPAKICITLPVGAHHIQAMVSLEPARMAWPSLLP